MCYTLQKLIGKKDILAALNTFSDVFPHLCKRIGNMETYAEKLSQNAEFYFCMDVDCPVGLVAFYANNTENKTAYISLIGVKSPNQGQGIGRLLLNCCEAVARSYGMVQLDLEVDCDNVRAIRFYTANGFVRQSDTERNSMYLRKTLI